jgi:hypothetical protein
MKPSAGLSRSIEGEGIERANMKDREKIMGARSDATTTAARAIVDAEKSEHEAKTARLREAAERRSSVSGLMTRRDPHESAL